ncbi:MAG: acetyl-CoA carboxylase biotin carboxyl carrier protein [Heliobacteriaceae bacterium]|jgi:acetyl-CoA carboxylase biotin carboxyl carrier protein|nr:acetyl-CoA carboxylase biotin carboxyl carrier protein [Heliobacteriaceae bacterium]
MKLDIEYIKKIAKIIIENSLTEISLEDGQQAITVKREIAAPVQAVPAAAPAPAAAAETPKGRAITSPMVGTFYKASSPDAKPFVEIGQTINAGDVVCIIEAMKLMNEIESEFSGKIIEICVEDAQPVEFGQTLMYIE